jgi:hypothetical protein
MDGNNGKIAFAERLRALRFVSPIIVRSLRRLASAIAADQRKRLACAELERYASQNWRIRDGDAQRCPS